MRSTVGRFNDCDNILVTAPSIEGPWSDPIYLNSNGIDPALLHDNDGRTWLLNTVWKYDTAKNIRYTDLILQELDTENNTLIGKASVIFSGTGLGATEGPRLYKHNDYYYLFVAEGGTKYGHGVTVARSKNLLGPYEVDPMHQMLSARGHINHPIQKSGHASIVETQTGEWYMAYLCGRPLVKEQNTKLDRRCILGRETAIERVVWNEDGWLRTASGDQKPAVTSPAPDLKPQPFEDEPSRDHFDSEKLNLHLMSLRTTPEERWLSLKERPGHLMIRGGQSLQSINEPHVIARTVDSFKVQAETCLEFNPETHQQMAGLVAIYNEKCYHYLSFSHDELTEQNCLRLLSCDQGEFSVLKEIPFTATKAFMRAVLDHCNLTFQYSENGENWNQIGEPLDATILSDECGPGFTGAFIGMTAQDFDRRNQPAYFDYFDYKKL